MKIPHCYKILSRCLSLQPAQSWLQREFSKCEGSVQEVLSSNWHIVSGGVRKMERGLKRSPLFHCSIQCNLMACSCVLKSSWTSELCVHHTAGHVNSPSPYIHRRRNWGLLLLLPDAGLCAQSLLICILTSWISSRENKWITRRSKRQNWWVVPLTLQSWSLPFQLPQLFLSFITRGYRGWPIKINRKLLPGSTTIC